MFLSSDPLNTLENLIAYNKTKSVSVYLIVIIVFIGFLACLPIIKVDISSQSKGIVRAKQDNVLLNTILSGKITQLNLKNNKTVKKGDTLLVVTKETLISQKKLNDTLLKVNKAYLNDLNTLLGNKTSTILTAKAKETYNQYLAKKSELTSAVRLNQKNYIRQKTLYNKGVIALVEFENHTYNLETSKLALNLYIKQQRTQWEIEKEVLSERIQTIENTLKNLEVDAKNHVLTAPISGTLENVLGLQVGAFVNASQTIGNISPNTNLIIENTVTPNDIGLLKVGQDVKFQFDAFSYNQWGMLNGEIIDIDNNITIDNTTAYFKVRCSLNTKQLQLKNGYKASISKGMTLTTRYFITRRSLYDLLFDKVDDWFNPKVITTENL